MNTEKIEISRELDCHFTPVEKLAAQAFGPGRFTRTAFRLREGVAHEELLSFVALKSGQVVGSVRVTKIFVGKRVALVLGPLVVDPLHNNEGIGSQLMETAVCASRDQGHDLIILVGDEPYYRPFGFKQIPQGQIIMPGPVDPGRFLYCELNPETFSNYIGMARTHS